VSTTKRWLQIAQWAEAVFGALSFVNWLIFPFSPTRGVGAAITWAYFLGCAVVALGLAWRFGGGGRTSWYVAAVLSAVVLLIAVTSLPRLWAFAQSPLTEYIGLTTLLGPTLYALTQVVVAVSLACTSHLRQQNGPSQGWPSNGNTKANTVPMVFHFNC
jgi:hypothetical protein